MIDIYGGGFRNKGAHLMLLTVLHKLRQADSKVSFCIEPWKEAPYEERSVLALHQLFPPLVAKRPRLLPLSYKAGQMVSRFVPKHLYKAYGLVRRGGADALIDISGYSFGDAWGWRCARNFSIYADDYRRKGKPVVMLPQMFGPFKDPKVAEMTRRILNNATLVYARDRISLQHAEELVGKRDNLRLAPDITIFMGAIKLPDITLQERDFACIVPNCRMLDQGKHAWGEVYMQRLLASARQLAAHGLKVKVIVHDAGGADLKMAQELMTHLQGDAYELFVEDDPIALKAFISRSRLLVASRFHSVVGALSSGVPSIALGWAHKYQMLMEDFEVPDLIHRDSDPAEHLTALIASLLDDQQWAQRNQTLLAAKKRMTEQNEKMWQEVFEATGLQLRA